MSDKAYIVLLEFGRGLEVLGIPPPAIIGAPYTFTWAATGGLGPYGYVLTGTLPPTFTWDAPSATLASTAPTTPATETVTLDVTDAARNTVRRTYELRVLALPLQITGALPAGTVGVAWTTDLTLSGGVAPYVSAQVLVGPAWMTATLAGVTITLDGMPDDDWDAPVKIEATDSDGVSSTFTATLVVAWPELTLAGTFADGFVGSAYSSDLTITGGNGVYSDPRTTLGTLPPGLGLSVVAPNILRLSGPPTAAFDGTFTAAVDSGDGQTATSVQTPDISTVVLPAYMVGFFSSIAGVDKDIAKIASDGSLDSWVTSPHDGSGSESGLAVDHTRGWVYTGGIAGKRLHRYSVVTGILDASFDPISASNCIPLLIDQAGNLLIFVRNGTFLGHAVACGLVRLTPADARDAGFEVFVTATNTLTVCAREASDGSLVFGGTFSGVNGVTRDRVAKVSSSGVLDTAWPNIGGSLSDDNHTGLSIDSQDRVWIAKRTSLNRIDLDGTNLLGFAFSGGNVTAVAVDSQDRVIVGGSFDIIDAVARQSIARLDSDGNIDLTFDANANSTCFVQQLHVQADDQIIVAATSMTSIGGGAHVYAAMVDESGNEVPTWPGNPDQSVHWLAQ